MGGGDINMPAPQQVNYGESMREALQAQVDLAPELYAAEADPNFGRKAYARLSQDVAMDSLLGEAVNYDSEGRIIEGYDAVGKGKIPDNQSVSTNFRIVDKKTGSYLQNL